MKYSSVCFQIILWTTSGLIFLASSAPINKVTSKRSLSSHRIDCSAVPGAVQNTYLRNSAFYLYQNGSICCPPKNCPASEDDMKSICGSRGIVDEPCLDCKTCGKVKGERCHGLQFKFGECGERFSCINAHGTVMVYEYDEGICTDLGGAPTNLQPGDACGGKFGYLGTCESESHCTLEQDKDHGVCVKNAKTKASMEKCGGRFGTLGRCADGLRCSALEDEFLKGANITGVCLSNRSADVCFKDCSGRNTDVVCGDNGVWYDNICYLRQSNCFLSPGKTRVRKDDAASSCDENEKPIARHHTSPNDNSSNSTDSSSRSDDTESS